MSVLGAMGIAKLALSVIDNSLELWKSKTPDWKQKQEFKMVNRYYYLKDMYEIEKKKPRYDEDETEEFNRGARSTDTMLNLRDKCLQYGEEVTAKLRST
jgi:hypothetical protein